MSNTTDIADATWVTGAMMYSYWNSAFKRMFHKLIVWDSGQLYFVEFYGMVSIKEICLVNMNFSCGSMYDVFKVNHAITLCGNLYYEILSRIEDIYGMSIDEFSLGKLDHD